MDAHTAERNSRPLPLSPCSEILPPKEFSNLPVKTVSPDTSIMRPIAVPSKLSRKTLLRRARAEEDDRIALRRKEDDWDDSSDSDTDTDDALLLDKFKFISHLRENGDKDVKITPLEENTPPLLKSPAVDRLPM